MMFGDVPVQFSTGREAGGIASGEFAAWAVIREHGAYAHMPPGQFRQFAVRNLGPTAPFYDTGQGTMVRGWSGMVHTMNLERAHAERARITADTREDGTPEPWADF